MRPGIEPIICRTHGKYANHYAIDAVVADWKGTTISIVSEEALSTYKMLMDVYYYRNLQIGLGSGKIILNE